MNNATVSLILKANWNKKPLKCIGVCNIPRYNRITFRFENGDALLVDYQDYH